MLLRIFILFLFFYFECFNSFSLSYFNQRLISWKHSHPSQYDNLLQLQAYSRSSTSNMNNNNYNQKSLFVTEQIKQEIHQEIFNITSSLTDPILPPLTPTQLILQETLQQFSKILIKTSIDSELFPNIIADANQPLTILNNIQTFNLTSQQLYYYLAASMIQNLQPKGLTRIIQKKPNIYFVYGTKKIKKSDCVIELGKWILQNHFAKKLLIILNHEKDIPLFEKTKKSMNSDGGMMMMMMDYVVVPNVEKVPMMDQMPLYQKAINKAKTDRYDLVIFDYPGKSYLDKPFLDDLKYMEITFAPEEMLLVLDANNIEESTYTAVRAKSRLTTTGFILSNLDKNPMSGLVLNLDHLFFNKISIKFEYRGEITENQSNENDDTNDKSSSTFAPFNSRKFIFDLFQIQNTTIFNELVELAELFGSKLKLRPQLYQDFEVMGRLITKSEERIMVQFFQKMKEIYEVLTEEEKNHPYCWIDESKDAKDEKKLIKCQQIANRRKLSPTSVYCLGLFITEYASVVYKMFNFVREVADFSPQGSSSSSTLAKEQTSKTGFGSVASSSSSLSSSSGGKGFGNKNKLPEKEKPSVDFDNIRGKFNKLPREVSSFFPSSEQLKEIGLFDLLGNIGNDE